MQFEGKRTAQPSDFSKSTAQMLASQIERATHLLPQIKKKRVFDYSKAVDGLRQILWGLFKKIVIADNCAFFVNQIFENSASHSATELWIGMFLFSFQIYGDFSGYSDIALGTSKLFGIDLLRNFNFPYFLCSSHKPMGIPGVATARGPMMEAFSGRSL